MDNIREICYKIKGLSEVSDSVIAKIESNFSGVKGVIGVKFDKEKQTVTYALDQWASDYDALCKLDEICEDNGLEIDYDGLDGEKVDKTEVEETEEEVEVTEIEDDEPEEEQKEVKKGKLTKNDFIEKAVIFGLSIIFLAVGLLVKNSNATQFIFLLAFTIASYETLYNAIIKFSEKRYVLEEILTFAGSIILMYLGYTAIATLIMLLFGALAFVKDFATHKFVSQIEKLELKLEETEDEEQKEKLAKKIEFLNSLEGICDKSTAKAYKNKLKFNISAIIVAVLVTFIPPFFKISQYGYELINTWLLVGAYTLILSCFGEVLFANLHSTKLVILTADKKGVEIKNYEKYLKLAEISGVFFDKTGVLTDCDGVVTEVTGDRDLTLKTAVSILSDSSFHIAKIITDYAKGINAEKTTDFKEISGRGITCKINGKQAVLGNIKHLKDNGIAVDAESKDESPVYICLDGKLIGTIYIGYNIKPDSYGAITELNEDLYLDITLLSSDGASQVTSLKNELNIKNAVSGASPKFKAEKVNQAGGVYVGNEDCDGKTLSLVDTAITFGKGGEISVLNGEVRQVPNLIKTAIRSKSILKTNLRLTAIIKIICLLAIVSLHVLTPFKLVWLFVIVDFIVRGLTVLNAYRNCIEAV